METLRSRPKGDCIEKNDWQALYTLTEHWQSDLMFYGDDLKFLHHLIDRYFIWITNKEGQDRVAGIAENILTDKRDGEELLKRSQNHLAHLSKFIDGSHKDNGQIFRKEHGMLEDDISRFISRVRKNRKQVFGVTEYMLDREKLDYLLQ